MKYRALAALPILLALALTAAALAVDHASVGVVLQVAIESAKVLALIGCAAAALAFERGDYLRRGWALNGACFVFLLVRDITIAPKVAALVPAPIDLWRALLVIAANASTVAGTWWMARTGHVAGIELPGSLLTRRAALGAAALFALVITGAPLAADTVALAGGDLRALVSLASDLGDIVSLCMLAPMLWTALAMRGGRLVWPWGLFAASLVAWLLYDAAAALPHLVTVDAARMKIVTEALRTAACGFIFSAGLAQRMAVRS